MFGGQEKQNLRNLRIYPNSLRFNDRFNIICGLLLPREQSEDASPTLKKNLAFLTVPLESPEAKLR